MLDYSLDKYGRKNFILNFEEDGDNIKVNLASGEDYSVPNTLENKKNLLHVMEEQVNNAWEYRNKQNKAKKSAKHWLIYNAIGLAINGLAIFLNPSIPIVIAIGCFVSGGFINILNYKECVKDLKDLEKHELFLRNKKSINEYLNRGNENIKDETLNPIKSEEIAPVLNINDVHNLSHEDITNILSDMDRDKRFNIDRPKVLTKRYIDIKNENSK